MGTTNTFYADSMLGKLTRWLRLLGYDTEYFPNTSDKELLKVGMASERILLTSDRQLFRSAVGKAIEAALIVVADDHALRLAKLAKRFHLRLDVNLESCRCPECNWQLKATDKREIVREVPQSSLRMFQQFWKCTNPQCVKVYWRGSHWANINEILHEAQLNLNRM